MRKTISTMLAGLAITAVGMFAADNTLGTWKLNAAKSKTTSANPAKSQTDVREALPDGSVKTTRTSQLADGTTVNVTFTLKYDGKNYPVTGAPYDTIAVKRVDDNTTTFVVSKTGGKLRMTGKSVVSKDGKTRTMTSSGTGADGKPESSTLVFDRQ
jgi:hypothetical protein